MTYRTSLHQALYDSLQSIPTEKLKPRKFELTTLVTKPFRTYTLFPHAHDPTIPILRTDYLILLAETFNDYKSNLIDKQITVPIFALEASLYTISNTSVQILYISKIDTTGLSPLPAPSSLLTNNFLSYFLFNLPKSILNLRIHIFARAAREGQYLFPASAENALNGPGDGAKLDNNNNKLLAGKRILDDQQLVKWWHKTLSNVIIGYHTSKKDKILKSYYILPGFDEQESSEVLPISKEIKEIWNYGHPYNNQISTPFFKYNSNLNHQLKFHLLADLIPAFNDDPKARFLHSIGDCSTNPCGEPGDWDDAILERSSTALENDRNRERIKINQISPDEFWDRMGGRQECCDGHVSAFFVLMLNRSDLNNSSISNKSPSSNQEDSQNNHHLNSTIADNNGHSKNHETPKHLIGVSRNVWIKLWSKIHNHDYAKLESASIGYQSWKEDVKSSINSSFSESQLKKKSKMNDQNISTNVKEVNNEDSINKDNNTENKKNSSDLSSFDNCHSVILVDNSLKPSSLLSNQNGSDTSKRFHDEKSSQVNVLQPRKKPKK